MFKLGGIITAMKRVVINQYIVADPKICHGKPTFKGTRIMVWRVLEMLKAGEGIEAIVQDFPSLSPKHIEAALAYASSLTKEGYVVINTTPQIST